LLSYLLACLLTLFGKNRAPTVGANWRKGHILAHHAHQLQVVACGPYECTVGLVLATMLAAMSALFNLFQQ
jgi:hypothetical protein